MDEIDSWFRSIINCHESQLDPGHHQGDQSRALHHDAEDNWPLDPQPDSHEDSEGNLASFSRSIPAKTVRSSNTEICDPPETFRNQWPFFFWSPMVLSWLFVLSESAICHHQNPKHIPTIHHSPVPRNTSLPGDRWRERSDERSHLPDPGSGGNGICAARSLSQSVEHI